MFSGLTGVGGGVFLVPLFSGVLGLSQHRAHGTSLLVVIFIAGAALSGYLLSEAMDWRLFLTLSAGSTLGAYAGAQLMRAVRALRLRVLFGLFLLAVATRMLLG